MRPEAPAPEASESAEALPVEKIEAQVDALLDQAQQQVQSMSELVGEPASDDPIEGGAPQGAAALDAPPPSTAPPEQSRADPPAVAAGAVYRGSPAPIVRKNVAEAIGPLDTDALQSQVDAILADASQVAMPPESESHTGPQPPPDPPDTQTPGPAVAASQPGAEVDLASLDAVIADAAQRAMEEDEFGAIDPSRRDGDAPRPTASATPAGGTPPAPATAPAASAPTAAPRREPVAKGGDAPPRREMPAPARPRACDIDLDGDFPAPAVKAPAPPAPSPAEKASWLRTALSWSDPLRGIVAGSALRALTVINSPWKKCSPSTQKAVLALTFVNVVLALGAGYVLLRRWR